MKTTGDELLLAHMQVLSEGPSTAPNRPRLIERVEPALAEFLVRALRLHAAFPRGSRRL